MSEPPCMTCPECDEDVLPAEAHGVLEEDEYLVRHPPECDCGECQWLWYDGTEARCSCGTLVRISADGENAYAHEVDE
jgi:hypothetical protein